MQAERRAVVFDVLSELSHQHREALQYRYMDGQSVVQISKLCQMIYSATNSMLCRARESFREAMERAERTR